MISLINCVQKLVQIKFMGGLVIGGAAVFGTEGIILQKTTLASIVSHKFRGLQITHTYNQLAKNSGFP